MHGPVGFSDRAVARPWGRAPQQQRPCDGGEGGATEPAAMPTFNAVIATASAPPRMSRGAARVAVTWNTGGSIPIANPHCATRTTATSGASPIRSRPLQPGKKVVTARGSAVPSLSVPQAPRGPQPADTRRGGGEHGDPEDTVVGRTGR